LPVLKSDRYRLASVQYFCIMFFFYPKWKDH
jgi:hypothetical protein